MQQTLREAEFAGRIAAGMDVCDVSGEKIGTVANVHQRTGPAGHDRVLEVKTGFLGLGEHLYVPLSAVHDMTEGCIFLALAKDAAEAQAWRARPADLRR
jgi:hypothetical protein